MKHLLVVFGKGQIAWEVLVSRVSVDDLIGVDGIENGLACNQPALETHVHVRGPKDRPLPDACLDKCSPLDDPRSVRRFCLQMHRLTRPP